MRKGELKILQEAFDCEKRGFLLQRKSLVVRSLVARNFLEPHSFLDKKGWPPMTIEGYRLTASGKAVCDLTRRAS